MRIFLSTILVAALSLEASALAGCRYTSDPDVRCCTEDSPPTWWCKDTVTEKTSDSCSIGAKTGVLWRCAAVAAKSSPSNPPPLPKELTPSANQAENLCDNSFRASCQYDRAGIDPGFVRITPIKTRIRREALAQAVKPVSQGGCAKPDQSAPPSGSDQEAVLKWIHEYAYWNLNDHRWERKFCLAKIIEKKIYAEIKTLITPEEVNSVFEETRSTLIDLVKRNVVGSPDLEPIRAEMITELNRVQFITADRFQEYALHNVNPDPHATIRPAPGMELTNDDTGGTCGEDLLTRNMFASSTGYKNIHTGMLAVVLCPAQLLEVLKNKGGRPVEAFYQILGHEMAHHIHAVRNRPALGHVTLDGTPMTTNFTPSYAPFIHCMKDHYESLLSDTSLDNAELQKIFGRPLTKLDIRIAEISADWWGDQVLAERVKRTSDPTRNATTVTNALQRLCYNGSNTLSVTDTSSHPSGQFRLEMAMRLPSIRAALGCGMRPGQDRAAGIPACRFDGSADALASVIP